MTPRAAAFVESLAALPDDAARLAAGLPQLHELFREMIRAWVPPNPQFERERIIAQAPNPRELVFLFGLLSEGENEAALLLELIAEVLAANAAAPVAHIADEAWYYLRTSIDPAWQLDDGAPSMGAALAYLYAVLDNRREGLRVTPSAPPLVNRDADDAASLLRALRSTFSAVQSSVNAAPASVR
jgi:hypothetical protein